MVRIDSPLRRLSMMFLVLSIFMPFSVSADTVDDSPNEQTTLQESQETTGVEDVGSDGQQESTSTSGQN